MKALTSDQEQVIRQLIEFAGGNEALQRAFRLGGKPEMSMPDLVRLIARVRLKDSPRESNRPLTEVVGP